MFDYDSELVRYHQRLWASLDIQAGDHVLDIGCGTGQTTRDAARAASPGTALGVDVSDQMLAQARQHAESDGLDNVRFVRADAQTHAFSPEHFSLGVSRFGTMFFSDPEAAFANIGRALRPGARLVQLVWQASDRQEWVGAVRQALTGARSVPTAPDHGAFSLADPTVTANILTTAGFTSVEATEVHEPVYYGPDAPSAKDALVELRMVDGLTADLDAAAAAAALDRLMTMLDAHDTGNGVWFDSRAWLVVAQRR